MTDHRIDERLRRVSRVLAESSPEPPGFPDSLEPASVSRLSGVRAAAVAFVIVLLTIGVVGVFLREDDGTGPAAGQDGDTTLVCTFDFTLASGHATESTEILVADQATAVVSVAPYEARIAIDGSDATLAVISVEILGPDGDDPGPVVLLRTEGGIGFGGEPGRVVHRGAGGANGDVFRYECVDASDGPVAPEDIDSAVVATPPDSSVAPDDEDPIRELIPVRVECSAELEAYPCAALIDGDPDTEWQAPDGGVRVTLAFYFDRPMSLQSVVFENLGDEVRFERNRRIRSMEIALDDVMQATYVELPDSNDEGPQIQLRSLATTVVTIGIIGTYPGVRVGDLEPFSELALGAVTFFGRDADLDAVGLPDGTGSAYVCDSVPSLDESGLSEEEYDARYSSLEGRLQARNAGEIIDTHPPYMGLWTLEVIEGFDLGAAIYIGCETRTDGGLTYETMYWTDGVGSLDVSWQQWPQGGDTSILVNEWSTSEQRQGVQIVREIRELVVSRQDQVINTVRVFDGDRLVSAKSFGLPTLSIDDLETIGLSVLGGLPTQ